MEKKPETVIINGTEHELPHEKKIYEICHTVNIIYKGDTSYTRCDNYGEKFINPYPEPPIDGGEDEWA